MRSIAGTDTPKTPSPWPGLRAQIPDPDMTNDWAHTCADQVTFKAFLNCYMREISAGAKCECDAVSPTTLEFALPRSFAKLRVQIAYWSLTGPHAFGAISLCNAETGQWRPAAISEVIPMLIGECFARTNQSENYKMPELMRRVLNSYDQIRKYCQHADADGRMRLNFLTTEQALYFGHWLHPTPKSREGMTDWQQQAYAPEFGRKFQLRYFAAHNSIALTGSANGRYIHDILADIPDLDIKALQLRPDETLIPMHPLQAEALCLKPRVRQLFKDNLLRDLGPAGGAFAATSSVRTVYAADCPWMLKFSIPVKITNSQRVNLFHELEAGVLMTRLLDKTGFLDSQPKFKIINDPAYVSLALPGCRESGFEVILRENPFMGRAQDGIVNIAALTADPLPGQQSLLAGIITDLSRQRNTAPAVTATQWFHAYLDCALRPALALYDTVGIALEAHQQNSLLDLSDGFPTRYYFRDNQGYYVSENHVERLAQLEPQLRRIDALCFPEKEINQRFCYYLFVNQIFSVISRLGRDGFVSEAALLGQLKTSLQDCATSYTGAARSFVNFMLTSPELSSKANLLTRIHDVDELEADAEKAVYVKLPNPIFTRAPQTKDEVRNVNA